MPEGVLVTALFSRPCRLQKRAIENGIALHDELAFSPLLPVQYTDSHSRSKVNMLCRRWRMPIQRVGHVVIKMRDLDAAKRFYRDILGMKITDEREGFGVFFRFQDYHHDIAVFKVGDDAESPQKNQVGLAHIALIADSFDTVKAMYQRLKAHDVPIVRTVDHGITKSVYFKDPEGNELEIYCEVPERPWQEQETIIVADPIDLEAVSGD